MTRIVDLMADLDWSEADLENRTRAQVNSIVSAERQDELRTIMLGHIAGMRTATASELAEITTVKGLVEQAGQDLIQGRADMALLRDVWGYEKALQTLGDDPSDAQAQAVVDRTSAAAVAIAQQRAWRY